jgi:hypothetical protein
MIETDYRPLSSDERATLEWLLMNGPENAKEFLPQLEFIQARRYCKCGCPSIEFSLPLEVPLAGTPPISLRTNVLGRSGNYDVGIMLVAGYGVLSELEIYTFEAIADPFDLPTIDSLKYVQVK